MHWPCWFQSGQYRRSAATVDGLLGLTPESMFQSTQHRRSAATKEPTPPRWRMSQLQSTQHRRSAATLGSFHSHQPIPFVSIHAAPSKCCDDRPLGDADVLHPVSIHAAPSKCCDFRSWLIPAAREFLVSIHAAPSKCCDTWVLLAQDFVGQVSIHPAPSKCCDLRGFLRNVLYVLVFQSTQHRRSAATTSWSRARTSECTFQSTQHRRSAATVNL